MLVVGDSFKRKKKTLSLNIDGMLMLLSQRRSMMLSKMYKSFNDDDLVPESEMVESFLDTSKM